MTKSDAGRLHPCDPGVMPLKNIYHMFAYAFAALETGEYRRLAGEEFNHIHDFLAAILTEGLGSQRRHGLEYDYEPLEEDLVFARGRIDPAATMWLSARRNHWMRCHYDERIKNTVVNRILKIAARRLLLYGDMTRRHRTRPKSILPSIGSVEILSGEELRCLRWDTLPTHRGNRSYQPLMGVPRLVLDGLLLSHVEGGLELAGSLDPQAPSALYERSVLACFRRHRLGLRPATSWVDEGIENAPVFLSGVYTDVVLTGPSRTLVIDTKYYGRILGAHHDHKILSAGNRNQIYGHVIHEAHDPRQYGREVKRILLYAQTTVDPPLRETWTETGYRLRVRILDLDQGSIEIASRLGEIASLVEVVWTLRGQGFRDAAGDRITAASGRVVSLLPRARTRGPRIRHPASLPAATG